MLQNIMNSCREQTSEGGTITKYEAQMSVEKFAIHALRKFDNEGRTKAFAVVNAAMDFLEYFGGLPAGLGKEGKE